MAINYANCCYLFILQPSFVNYCILFLYFFITNKVWLQTRVQPTIGRWHVSLSCAMHITHDSLQLIVYNHLSLVYYKWLYTITSTIAHIIFLFLVKFIAKLFPFITQVLVPPAHHFKWLTPFSLYLPLCLSSLGLRGMKMIPRQRNEISLCLVGICYSKWKSSGTKI